MHDQIHEESRTNLGISKVDSRKPSNSIANMANEEDKLVWVKLVIDGKNVGQAFQVEIASKTNNVDHLKRAVAKEYQHKLTELSIDAPSLDVYLPGTTNVSALEGAEPLRPGLRLADLDFREITDETPLIVTAKTRPQQQQDTNVSLCRWQILS
jgi:Crinkler effector protein N-terminal domain